MKKDIIRNKKKILLKMYKKKLIGFFQFNKDSEAEIIQLYQQAIKKILKINK